MAAVTLQRWWRGVAARKRQEKAATAAKKQLQPKVSNVQATMFAAMTIQRAFKKYIARKRRKEEVRKMTSAAVMIQKNYKGKLYHYTFRDLKG